MAKRVWVVCLLTFGCSTPSPTYLSGSGGIAPTGGSTFRVPDVVPETSVTESSDTLTIERALLEGDMGPIRNFAGVNHEIQAMDYAGDLSHVRVDALDSRGRWFMMGVTVSAAALSAPNGATFVYNPSEFNGSSVTDLVVCGHSSGRGEGFEWDEHPGGQVTINDNPDGSRTLNVSTTNTDGSTSRGQVVFRVNAAPGSI